MMSEGTNMDTSYHANPSFQLVGKGLKGPVFLADYGQGWIQADIEEGARQYHARSVHTKFSTTPTKLDGHAP